MPIEPASETNLRTVAAEPKGVLDPALAKQKFRLARYLPGQDLAGFIEHYWIVAWDLCGQPPHLQRTLPYPNVNLVFDAGRTAIFGVMRGAFEYRQENRGRVLGVRFLPGGFRGLLRAPLITITDRTTPLAPIYGLDGAEAETGVLTAPDDEGMVAAAEAILRRNIPESDANADLVNRIVSRIDADRDITRIDQLAVAFNLSPRALQRLFSDYVGVSPKWAIRRSRLHEAAFRLAGAETLDLTRFAQELGYFDQAHFARDFKTMVGQAPSQYRRGSD
ncbi:helix-turn-helix domain-containing protein [Methylocapsa sp. S129]|uniref:AraC family transcriptional regulator n=1 Tax=Methylocapsa sp. S129 TaxID=1641869 RepID=UPI00131E32D1|nr:helix-turn-helix domain-containing protein [Methylocapsa sp. S129]